MNDKAKKFLTDVRKLNITASLSKDKTFVIFEPTLPPEMIMTAIELGDYLCHILADEERLLSPEDSEIIDGIVDSDEIYSTFKLTDPTPEEIEDINAPVVYEKMTPESFDKDFDYIRKNLKDIIKQGSRAIERMLTIAEASQHPRAFEVAATLMKTMVDANKHLLDSHKQKIETNELSGVKSTTNIQNNNSIFVGSTSELSKLLKKQNKDN
jgi:hypothetical protein